VLRRIFGPRKDEVTGGWRKLKSEELHNLHSSADVTRTSMKWGGGGHVARRGIMRNV
jgi:hypothetical protein